MRNYLIGEPSPSIKFMGKHCWFRFRFHKWSDPFKKDYTKITIYKRCLTCGWSKIIGVD